MSIAILCGGWGRGREAGCGRRSEFCPFSPPCLPSANLCCQFLVSSKGSCPNRFIYPQWQLPKLLGSCLRPISSSKHLHQAFPKPKNEGNCPVPFPASPGMCLSLKKRQGQLWPSCQPKNFPTLLCRARPADMVITYLRNGWAK